MTDADTGHHLIDDLIRKHRGLADGIFRHHGVHPFDAPVSPDAGQPRDPAPAPPHGLPAALDRIVHEVRTGHLVHPDPPSLAAQIAAAREPQAPAPRPAADNATMEEHDMSPLADVRDIVKEAAATASRALPLLEAVVTDPRLDAIVEAALAAAGAGVADEVFMGAVDMLRAAEARRNTPAPQQPEQPATTATAPSDPRAR